MPIGFAIVPLQTWWWWCINVRIRSQGKRTRWGKAAGKARWPKVGLKWWVRFNVGRRTGGQVMIWNRCRVSNLRLPSRWFEMWHNVNVAHPIVTSLRFPAPWWLSQIAIWFICELWSQSTPLHLPAFAKCERSYFANREMNNIVFLFFTMCQQFKHSSRWGAVQNFCKSLCRAKTTSGGFKRGVLSENIFKKEYASRFYYVDSCLSLLAPLRRP